MSAGGHRNKIVIERAADTALPWFGKESLQAMFAYNRSLVRCATR